MRTGQRYFLDTNVLVYCFIEGEREKRAISRRLVKSALESRDGIISYQVVQEFLNVATKKPQRRMSQAEAQVFLGEVLIPLCEVFPDAALYSTALSIAD